MANNGNPAQHQKPHYPTEPSSYTLLNEIGFGPHSVVYNAKCTTLNNIIVAIKIIHWDDADIEPDSLMFHANAMSTLSHPNILETHCSFIVANKFWIVMPYMSIGSMESIISNYYPNGVKEACLAVVLNEILKALCHLHEQGRFHYNVKASNVLIGEDGIVKLADFGMSGYIQDCILNERDFDAQEPYWIAPELSHNVNSRRVMMNGYKADVWSFGICALELARGRPPGKFILTSVLRFEKSKFYNPRKEYEFSESFKEMIELCLECDPVKRASCGRLLKHPFLKYCEGMKLGVESMLSGLCTVDRRIEKESQPRYTYKFYDDDIVVEPFVDMNAELEENDEAEITPQDPWIDNLLDRRHGGNQQPIGDGTRN